VLLVAATERELCGHPGLVCGIGPVEAAAATAVALARASATHVLHVGIAGGRELEPGTLVVGSAAVYCDLSAAIPLITRLEPDRLLLAAACKALRDAPSMPIGTSASVGGLCGTAPERLRVEAMEGFGVLRAAALTGVPALEVRAISNEIGEADRARWQVDVALAALAEALPALITAVAAAVGSVAAGPLPPSSGP
jgi:futalosine hydrolase